MAAEWRVGCRSLFLWEHEWEEGGLITSYLRSLGERACVLAVEMEK